jgi:hypothetical protein
MWFDIIADIKNYCPFCPKYAHSQKKNSNFFCGQNHYKNNRKNSIQKKQITSIIHHQKKIDRLKQ